MDDYDTKGLLASKAVWGGIIAVLAGAAGIFGYTVSPEDVERGWCEMGAWAHLGVATSMLHTLGHGPEEVCRGTCVRVVFRRQRELNSQSRHLRRLYTHRFRGCWS